MLRLHVGSDLKMLIGTLVKDYRLDCVGMVASCAEVVASNSEGAWSDSQGLRLAFEKPCQNYQRGSL